MNEPLKPDPQSEVTNVEQVESTLESIEIPLTVGVVGGVVSAVMFPLVAALGAIGALVAHLTLVIEKKE